MIQIYVNIFLEGILENIFLKNICFNIFLKRIFDTNICKYISRRNLGNIFLKNICFNIFLKRIFDTNICLAYDEKVHALNGYIRKTRTLVLFTNSIVLD